jgi:bla regulator protein blaR1
MMAFIANHLWQSTITTGLAGLLAVAFRRHRATVRHGLWLAASIKFLLPFALLVGAGSQISWRRAPLVDAPHIAQAVQTFGEPFAAPASLLDTAPIASNTPSSDSAMIATVLVVWSAGAMTVLVVWGARWRRVASMVRAGLPVTDGRILETLRRIETRLQVGRPLALVETESPLEPGVFGVLNPVLVWPRHIAAYLEDTEIETILAHEVVHVRRLDNLVAAAHMVVQAVFWFHPLVWWIGSRLVDERERACDEDVLLMGSDPRTYAEGILKTCRWFVAAPSHCVAGVTASDLRKRIEHIMARHARLPLTAWGRAVLGATMAAALSVPVVIGLLNAPLRAQTSALGDREAAIQRAIAIRESAMRQELDELRSAHEKLVRATGQLTAKASELAAVKPAFDVTSVKPNKSGSGRIMMLPAPGGGWSATNITLGMLIRIAFQLQDDQIAGGPKWLFEDRFDVLGSGVAPGSPETPLFTKLQSLLAERFNLVTHTESRELPMYALTLAKREGTLGPALTPSKNDCPREPRPGEPEGRGRGPQPFAMPAPGEIPKCGWMIGPGQLAAGGSPMEDLARNLSRLVGKIVVDQTNLTGTYDLIVHYTPDPGMGGRSDLPGRSPEPGLAPPVNDGPSIFSALQEQLGLKLESTKGPVNVLVIDRADEPMPN